MRHRLMTHPQNRNMANNIDKKEPVVICDQSKLDVKKCDINKVASNIELLIKEFRKTINAYG